MRLAVTVNGTAREADGVWEGESLLSALRDHLDLPGSKNACEQGECGSCSVYLDGTLVCSCLVLAAQAEGREVVTLTLSRKAFATSTVVTSTPSIASRGPRLTRRGTTVTATCSASSAGR